jgi:hypothetical protein
LAEKAGEVASEVDLEALAASVDEAAPVGEEKLVKVKNSFKLSDELKKPAKVSKALAAPKPAVKVASKAKVAKKPSATKSKTAGAKAKTPSAKAMKVTKPKVAAPAKEDADNLGDGEQSWFVRFPASRVIRESERAQMLLSVETKHIASLLTEWAGVKFAHEDYTLEVRGGDN